MTTQDTIIELRCIEIVRLKYLITGIISQAFFAGMSLQQ